MYQINQYNMHQNNWHAQPVNAFIGGILMACGIVIKPILSSFWLKNSGITTPLAGPLLTIAKC